MINHATPTQQPGVWIRFNNETNALLELVIEPYCLAWFINPGEQFIVLVHQKSQHYPEISFLKEKIVVFADSAIVYRGDEELINLSSK